jgi:nitroreductase
MELFEAIARRTSVRRYGSRRLNEAEWERLLRAAMAAPSAVDRRPWDFVVVEERKTLEALAAALPYAKMAAGAAGAVVVCASPGRAFQGSRDFALLDATAALENLLLAAAALGLGAVWTALYPEADREEAARAILGIPADVIPLALVPIGEPQGPAEPKDKYDPERIRRERW